MKPDAAADRISAAQWRTGAAAWLGWLFDGLDMHLYVLVAAPFVASLLNASSTDPIVQSRSAWIQAAFLLGWAVGGTVFGWLGDRIGRSRSLALTILTYALFTGLTFFVQSWRQLLILRFMAALGIGGEWGVGAALLAETWPARWRPWAAATLQTGVNIGILLACVVTYLLASRQRYVFLVGVAPALVVFWIRRHVPEPEQWLRARSAGGAARPPPMSDLFRPPVLSVTLRTAMVCGCSLTAWWAFLFWINQHIRNLPDLSSHTPAEREHWVSAGFFAVILVSIPGNFFAAFLARRLGYRRAISLLFTGLFAAMAASFITPHSSGGLLLCIPWVGFFSGVFGLFTMYLPPLFPTLLRTSGTGFSFNVGRLGAAAGTVIFGRFHNVGDFRIALLYDSLLLLPAIAVSLTLPELNEPKERSVVSAGGG